MKTLSAMSRMETFTAEPLQSKPFGKLGDEDPGVDRIEKNLEDRVERDEAGGVFVVSFRQFIPDDHHGDAARQADHDEARHVLGIAAQEDDCQRKHQHRADHPVLHQGEKQDFLVPEDFSEFLIADFGERRVHHQDQADGNGNRCSADRKAIQKRHSAREDPARPNPDEHGGEDPESEKAIEKAQTRGYAGSSFS